MPVTGNWPREDSPIEEQVQLIAALSPHHVFVFFHVDFRPRAFEFEDDAIVVRGTAYYSDSTVVLRLDSNGRRTD